jgi:hypothetical protein
MFADHLKPEAVRELLASDPIDGECRVTFILDVGSWQEVPAEAWRAVSFELDDGSEGVTVYYRREDGRFIVSDLGEGVKALRMRRGVLAIGNQVFREDSDLPAAICRVMLASYQVATLGVDDA